MRQSEEKEIKNLLKEVGFSPYRHFKVEDVKREQQSFLKKCGKHGYTIPERNQIVDLYLKEAHGLVLRNPVEQLKIPLEKGTNEYMYLDLVLGEWSVHYTNKGKKPSTAKTEIIKKKNAITRFDGPAMFRKKEVQQAVKEISKEFKFRNVFGDTPRMNVQTEQAIEKKMIEYVRNHSVKSVLYEKIPDLLIRSAMKIRKMNEK